MIPLITNTPDIFSTMIPKLIKIVIQSKMKKLFLFHSEKKMVPEGRRHNLCTEWHTYWLFVWWVKIMHPEQVQKMILNEQASCNALLARLNHCLSARFCQLHFYLLYLVEACFNDAFGGFQNLILYVNVTCSRICYRAPEMPTVKNNSFLLPSWLSP